MRIVKKLKLINWHFFNNQEFEFSSINVITGENGTGKSTILDAIHYLQSGGNCKFNRAANSHASGRSVENYLRARIGGEKREFFRKEDNIIGHIAIEYLDTSINKPFVLGCVLQLVTGKLSQPIFYQIRGKSWNDSLFFSEKNEVYNYDELEKEAKAQGLDISIIGTKSQSDKARREKVLQVLGVPNKYEILFSKALSFEPLQDISKFATEFLLPEAQLDLTSIKDSMDGYREIQDQVSIEKKRLNELQPIINIKEEYEKLLKQEFAWDILLYDSSIEKARRDKQNNIKNREIEEQKSRMFDMEYRKKTSQRNEYERKADEIAEKDAYKEIQELGKNKKYLLEQRQEIQNNISQWEKEINEEVKQSAQQMELSLDLLFNAFEKKDYQQYISILLDYRREQEKAIKLYTNEKIEIGIQKSHKKVEKNEVDEELTELRANSYAFPFYVTELMENIKTAIIQKEGSSENLHIQCLCTLCEVNDFEWKSAIEGFLANRRFDMFIDSQYKSIAKNVFIKSNLQDYFGVGIIDLNQIEKNVLENSLASKIDTFWIDKDGKKKELEKVRNYIDFLLGDILCVDSVLCFQSGKKAITREGIYFDGGSIRHVSLAAKKKPYIGQESIKARLDIAEKKSRELEKEMEKLSTREHFIDKILSAERNSRVNELLNKKNLWAEYDSIVEELQDVIEQIKKIENANDNILEMSKAIDDFRRMASEAGKNAEEALQNKREADIECGKLYTSIQNKEDEIKELQRKKANQISDNKIYFSNLEDYLIELRDGKKENELYEMAVIKKKQVTQSREEVERTIKKTITQYCINHPGEMIDDIENYMAFVQRYNKIVNDDLAKMNPALDSAKARAEEELCEHFISRIRNSLLSAKRDIKVLNDALKKHPFGSENEVFEFIGAKSSDTLLGSVYRIAMETNQDTVANNLFSESLDLQSQRTMEKVFDILSSNEDNLEFHDIKREIIDYRNYLNYDIKICTGDDNPMLYSKNQDSKSGGETQTPFYALIAGAFQSILNKSERDKRSPTSLVLFDEAFNTMDGERIRQMLEFYRELDIQLIISVPSSRFSYISPYCDNIICLAKNGYSVAAFQSIKR